jgi:predicted metalloprotease
MLFYKKSIKIEIMKWKGRRQSDNVNRRGMSSGGKTVVGGIIGYNTTIDKCFGGENAQMLTPVLEQMNQGQSTPTEQRDLTAKNWKSKPLWKHCSPDRMFGLKFSMKII